MRPKIKTSKVFSVRDIKNPAQLLGIVPTKNLLIEKLCTVCYEQGIIAPLHENSGRVCRGKDLPTRSFKGFQEYEIVPEGELDENVV